MYYSIFQKVLFSSERAIWVQFTPRLFNLISYDLSQSLVWNILAWWDTIDWQSLHWLDFPRNPLLTRFTHDSLSKKFEIGMMEYNSYTKVTVNLPKNSLFGQEQFGPNLGQNYATLCLMIHSPRSFLKICGMMRHNIDRKK